MSVLDTLFEGDLSNQEKFVKFCEYNLLLDIYSNKVAITYARRGIAFSQKANDPFIKGFMLSNLGLIYCNTTFYDSSYFYIEKSLKHFEEAEKYAKKAEMHGLLRYVYGQVSDFESALKHCYEALEIYTNLNDEAGIGATYNDIAGTLIKTNKYQEALSYAEKGKEILKKHDNLFELVMTTEKIAICNKELGKTQKALDIQNEAIHLATTDSSPLGIEYMAQLYNTRSQLHILLQKHDLVIKDFELIRNLYNEFPDHLYLNAVDALEANFYQEQQDFAKAKSIFLALYNKEETGLGTDDIYNGLANAYAGLGQFDSAYHFVRAYQEVSVLEKGHESGLKMEELKAQFETEQKEATIAIQEKQLYQQRIIQWLAIGFAAMLGLLFFQSYRNAQARKRNNEILEKTNALLEKKNNQNETLLKEIHHRVKNNLQTVSSLLSLQSNNITDPSALNAVQESRNRVASMALIHQKLYQGENLASIEMRDYFETIGNSILNSFGQKAAGVSLHVDMLPIEIDVDTAVPIGLITNELMTNSLKYAFKENQDAKIFISMKKEEDNFISLKISDNGTFDLSPKNRTTATGFGTMLIQLLTTQLDGQMEQSTTDGTATILRFPLKKKIAV